MTTATVSRSKLEYISDVLAQVDTMMRDMADREELSDDYLKLAKRVLRAYDDVAAALEE